MSSENLPVLALGEISPGRPLLVVATAAEATHFADEVDGLPMLITGIGRLRATLALTDCLHRYLRAGGLPSGIINVGTARALRTELSGVHRIDRVLLHDFSHSAIAALTGRDEYPPIDLRSEYSTGEHGEHAAPDTRDGIDRDAASNITLATGDIFVDSEALQHQLAQDADLVDMEGYAIATVARWFGVPVQLIKITDESTPHTHKRLNELTQSARELAALVRKELTSKDSQGARESRGSQE